MAFLPFGLFTSFFLFFPLCCSSHFAVIALCCTISSMSSPPFLFWFSVFMALAWRRFWRIASKLHVCTRSTICTPLLCREPQRSGGLVGVGEPGALKKRLPRIENGMMNVMNTKGGNLGPEIPSLYCKTLIYVLFNVVLYLTCALYQQHSLSVSVT